MTDDAVRDIAEELVAAGGEIALQAVAIRDGELLVDVATGVVDSDAPSTPITGEHLFPVFSVSKAMTTLTALRLIDRSVLGFDTPVAEVWPEFAANGKSDVLVGELLAHQAGLAALPDVPGFAELCDWEHMTRALAAAAPEGRGPAGYHALTLGWLVGETVRRALGDGRGFGEIMRDELLGVGPRAFWFGIPDDVEPLIVTVRRDVEPVDGARAIDRALPARFGTTQSVYGRPDVRRACLPAVNGIGNARTLASVFARAASGELLGGPVLEEATRPWTAGTDAITGAYVARGAGFYVSAPKGATFSAPFTPGGRAFGHPGAGGSLVWGDRATGTGFAICRSRLSPAGWQDPNVQRLIEALQIAVRNDIRA
ncbi:MAG: serine hydrolase domain-containing protein [Microbacterium sp.]